MLDLSYSVWFTPMTKVFSDPLPGAEMITFLAPASICPWAFSASTKRPVDSITYSTPSSPQFKAFGPSLLAMIHFMLEPAMHCVVLHLVGKVLSVSGHVNDTHHIELAAEEALVANRLEHHAADAAKAVDADLSR